MFPDKQVAGEVPCDVEREVEQLDPNRKVAAAGFKPIGSMTPTSADSIVHSRGL
jgi:hypothetical protein